MPRVSVIMPVFNAEVHVGETAAAVLAQTLEDFELIIVDDGSTDSTPGILAEVAASDDRVRVLRQDNRGAGAARNAGLDLAQGEYLYFADADDMIERTLLSEAYRRAVSDDADIAVFGSAHLDCATGTKWDAPGHLRTDCIPREMPFSYLDAPDSILTFTNPALWNKLFKRVFVEEAGLRFQEIPRANDFYFSRSALVLADRITTLDSVLVVYRQGVPGGLQSSRCHTPLTFLEALTAVKVRLQEAGRFEPVRRSFLNDAVGQCLWNLKTSKSSASFKLLYEALRSGAFEDLGLRDESEEYFFDKGAYRTLRRVRTMSCEAFLFEEAAQLAPERQSNVGVVARLEAEAREAERRLEKLRRTRTYRLAARLSSIARRARRAGRK